MPSLYKHYVTFIYNLSWQPTGRVVAVVVGSSDFFRLLHDWEQLRRGRGGSVRGGVGHHLNCQRFGECQGKCSGKAVGKESALGSLASLADSLAGNRKSFLPLLIRSIVWIVHDVLLVYFSVAFPSAAFLVLLMFPVYPFWKLCWSAIEGNGGRSCQLRKTDSLRPPHVMSLGKLLHVSIS